MDKPASGLAKHATLALAPMQRDVECCRLPISAYPAALRYQPRHLCELGVQQDDGLRLAGSHGLEVGNAVRGAGARVPLQVLKP